MKRLLSILIVVCLSIVLVSCGNSGYNSNTPSTNTPQTNTPSQPVTPEAELTAYEQLNENEKIIFDAFMIKFDQFYAPTTIRITKILTGYAGSEWDSCGDTIPKVAQSTVSKGFGISVTLKLTGETKEGSKFNSLYALVLYDGNHGTPETRRGHIYKVSEAGYGEEPEFKYASPAKLNKALIEYCEEMGLN